jgi:hypothetical protein
VKSCVSETVLTMRSNASWRDSYVSGSLVA